MPNINSDSPLWPIWNDATTEDDIYYCFRLLLGRNPNTEEWRYHLPRLGAELRSTVRSYLGSLEFSKRGLTSADEALSDIRVASINGATLYVHESDPVIGRAVLANIYEPEIVDTFKQFVTSGANVIDIGANVGFYTMLSATLVGTSGYVLAVEPNPANVKLLEASRLKNGFSNVEVASMAASNHTGVLMLNAGESNGTTIQGDADTEVLSARAVVPCIKVDSLVSDGRKIDFIKIDVEGAECVALQGMSKTIERCKPVLVSEFSPDSLPVFSGCSGRDYLMFLREFGYRLSVIEPNGSATRYGDNVDSVIDAFHLRQSDHIDILAVPD